MAVAKKAVPKELLDSLYLLGTPPQVVLFAVSIGPCDDLSTELTPAVERALPEIAALVRREVAEVSGH